MMHQNNIKGLYILNNTVQLKGGKKKQIKDLKIGDAIKTANKNYCHNFQNKLSCIPDKHNILYSSIEKIQLINSNRKSIVRIVTQTDKIIYSTLDNQYVVMRLQDGLNNYYKKKLYDILDSYQPNNFEYHGSFYRLITEDGVEIIKNFDIFQKSKLIVANIFTEHNENRIFVSGVLV